MKIKKKHEKLILKNKHILTALSDAQELYFQTLVEELALTPEGETWLFDYLHNHKEEDYDSFEDYLKKYNCQDKIFEDGK